LYELVLYSVIVIYHLVKELTSYNGQCDTLLLLMYEHVFVISYSKFYVPYIGRSIKYRSVNSVNIIQLSLLHLHAKDLQRLLKLTLYFKRLAKLNVCHCALLQIPLERESLQSREG